MKAHLRAALEHGILFAKGSVVLTIALSWSTKASGSCDAATTAMTSSAVKGVVYLIRKLTAGDAGVGGRVGSVIDTLTSSAKLLLVESLGNATELTRLSIKLMALNQARITGPAERA
jgi:hypothetical protein